MKNIGRNVINSVKLNRLELLGIVIANKEKHILEFEESIEDFKAVVIKLTKENLKLAKSGDLNKIAKIKLIPSKPVSYENNYSRAIRMLELSVEDEIVVEEDVFNQLVLDEWQWKTSFLSNKPIWMSSDSIIFLHSLL